MVSIVVPTYNEQENIELLLASINKSFNGKTKDYEVIVIDDNSTDNTRTIIKNLTKTYPVRMFLKIGTRGKAYSLFEGFKKANGDIVAMIDADLQYPANAIPKMVAKLNAQTDIVVANRKTYNDTQIRKFLSRGFRYVFGKIFFNLNCDVQSGLKVFKKVVVENVKFTPQSAWSFDLEFLYKSQEAGFRITSHNITFFARESGHSKIAVAKTVFELSTNTLRLKSKKLNLYNLFRKSQVLYRNQTGL